jgi:glucokinase
MSDQACKYRIGFDLGGTKMLAVLYDSEFKKVAQRRRKTKGYDGPESGVARILSSIHDVLDEVGADPSQLLSVGVGCPSPIDMERGIIVDAVNLGWVNVKLAAAINKEFDCSAAVLNDVDAGVYGEYCFGAGKKNRTVFGVFPGTGIGGGCVYDGRIVHGANHSCMEIGHVLVNPRGGVCGCGRRGCLETVASRLAISAEAAKAAYRGEAPWLMKEYGTSIADIRSGAIAASIKNGDAVVEQITRDAAYAIGVATASVVTLLLPDLVVLGGGLVEAMPRLFVSEVERGIHDTVMPAFAGTFEVRESKLGDDAAVLGAAAWAANSADQEKST